jgi:hypothetical protein
MLMQIKLAAVDRKRARLLNAKRLAIVSNEIDGNFHHQSAAPDSTDLDEVDLIFEKSLSVIFSRSFISILKLK